MNAHMWILFVLGVVCFAIAFGFETNIRRIRRIIKTFPDDPSALALVAEVPRARRGTLGCIILGVMAFLLGFGKAFGYF